MTTAELLLKELKARDIHNIYALCGNGLDPILDASHGEAMRIIDTRNEQAAAYMADTVGKLTRRIGVAMVSSGVAHLNALTGVCNAWFDGSPMLLITGASDSEYRGRGNFQDMETAALAEPLCKYSASVDRGEQLPWMLEEAIGIAVSGRPGPVHLTIPADVLTSVVPDNSFCRDAPKSSMVSPTGSADASSVEKAVAYLRGSKRPVIAAGSGVFYAEGDSALAGLAAALKAPVVVPIWDRGAIEDQIPEFCGVIGAASGQPSILAEADLILLIGADVDYRVGYLEPPAISQDAVIIRVGDDPNHITQGVCPHVGLVGNPDTVMRQIAQALKTKAHAADPAWLEGAKRRYAEFHGRWSECATDTGQQVVQGIKQAMDDDTFMLVDGGNIGQWYHMTACDRYPGRWLTCGRSGVVGWGFPGAAAVKSIHPDKRVLLLSGDGSSTFTIAEIETASRQNLPYVAVVADDQAWGIVISGSDRRNQPPIGSKLGPIDYVKVAEGFGARGVRVDDLSQLPEEIKRGFASNRVTVIHAPVKGGGPADL